MRRSCQMNRASPAAGWLVGHHWLMNADQVAALRALLTPTGWVDRTAWFGRALRARSSNGLFVIGPQAAEPWHMTAHLTDETRLARLPAPTLVRWAPPPGAPPPLPVRLDR